MTSPIIGRRAVHYHAPTKWDTAKGELVRDGSRPVEVDRGIIVWIGAGGQYGTVYVVMLRDDGALKQFSLDKVTVEGDRTERL